MGFLGGCTEKTPFFGVRTRVSEPWHVLPIMVSSNLDMTDWSVELCDVKCVFQLIDSCGLSKSYIDSAVQPFAGPISDGQSHSRPLLGYDWIAGVIDNDSTSLDGISDTYFDDVREFRRQNRDACVGSVDFM